MILFITQCNFIIFIILCLSGVEHSRWIFRSTNTCIIISYYYRYKVCRDCFKDCLIMDEFVNRVKSTIDNVQRTLTNTDLNSDGIKKCLDDVRQCLDQVYGVIDVGGENGGSPQAVFELRDQLRGYLVRLEAIGEEVCTGEQAASRSNFAVSNISMVSLINSGDANLSLIMWFAHR